MQSYVNHMQSPCPMVIYLYSVYLFIYHLFIYLLIFTKIIFTTSSSCTIPLAKARNQFNVLIQVV